MVPIIIELWHEGFHCSDNKPSWVVVIVLECKVAVNKESGKLAQALSARFDRVAFGDQLLYFHEYSSRVKA